MLFKNKLHIFDITEKQVFQIRLQQVYLTIEEWHFFIDDKNKINIKYPNSWLQQFLQQVENIYELKQKTLEWCFKSQIINLNKRLKEVLM